MIDRNTINRIIDRAEILDVVGDFVSLRKHGNDWIGLCPFHDDTRPSFHVSPQKNVCKCFACGEGGNPLSFVMKHEHLSFPEAVKYLGRKYGIEVEETQMSEEEKKEASERELLLRANSFARDHFVSSLHNDAEGRRVGLSYFRERGLSDETIKKFELGYSPASYTALYEKVKAEGEDPEVFEKTGLLIKRDNGSYIDRYRDRVIYPIHSISGNVVGFGGRILVKKENTGKYINSPASVIYDKSRELYGLYFAKKALSKKDRCLVVEGYMDVLSMHQVGVENVVASSGTALTAQQVQIIKRYTSNLVLIFDADAAGVKAALRGLDVGFEKDMSVSAVLLPEGEDPDSYAQSHTLEEVEAYIDAHTVDGLWFKAEVLRKELGDSVRARAEIAERLAESLSHHKNRVTRELYITDVASKMGISIEAFAGQVETLRRQLLQEQSRAKEREERQSGTSGFKLPSAPPLEPEEPLLPDKKEPAPKSEINEYEELLLAHILKQGTRIIARVPGRGEDMAELSAIDIISSETQDLREAGVLSPVFVTILDEIRDELGRNPETNLLNFLTWSETSSIRLSSERVIQRDFSLSPLHKSFSDEQDTGEVLTQMLMRDIMSYKYAFVLSEIRDVLGKLYALNPDGAETPGKETQRLLERFQELSVQKNFLAERLGERVINPEDKLTDN